MRHLAFRLLAAVLSLGIALGFAGAAYSQPVVRPAVYLDVADLPDPCEPHRVYYVRDASAVDDCATGGGSATAVCSCEDDGSGFEPLSGAGAAGWTFDDLGSVEPPGGFATSAGSWSFAGVTASGFLRISGDSTLGLCNGATQGTLRRVFGFDLYWCNGGGWSSLTRPTTLYDADGSGFSATLYDLGGPGLYFDDLGSEVASLSLGAQTGSLGLGDDGLTFTATVAGDLAVTGALELDPQSAPPVTCAAGTAGTLYADSDSAELCFCDGSTWTGLKAAGACS